jgi:hypothetical protein
VRQDDFKKQVSSKLDELAQHHPNKPLVMNHVLDKIQDKKSSRYGFLKMSGYAVAAAITGFIVIPNVTEITQQPTDQAVISPKLSPQMVEDLEMLMVMGEDEIPHGS